TVALVGGSVSLTLVGDLLTLFSFISLTFDSKFVAASRMNNLRSRKLGLSHLEAKSSFAQPATILNNQHLLEARCHRVQAA
ncbi:Eukaryotic translation initiation factor 3 subunit H, partial [Bienertia sinuspersici]